MGADGEKVVFQFSVSDAAIARQGDGYDGNDDEFAEEQEPPAPLMERRFDTGVIRPVEPTADKCQTERRS